MQSSDFPRKTRRVFYTRLTACADTSMTQECTNDSFTTNRPLKYVNKNHLKSNKLQEDMELIITDPAVPHHPSLSKCWMLTGLTGVYDITNCNKTAENDCTLINLLINQIYR